MSILSLEMKNEDLELLKEYARINNLNISSFVNELILNKIYDDFCEEDESEILNLWEKSKKEPKYDFYDVVKELGL